ncbi:MAG: zinc chelation protein SecC, partial [Rhizomicrobium sp.]
DKDFRDGITLIVSCGIGRGLISPPALPERPRWRREFVSAADLYTLSWTKGFDPLSLWRLLDAEGDVDGQGVELLNVNGLLNRVAWRRSLDGHMVPHRVLSEDFAQGEHQAVIMIDQTSLRRLRAEVLEAGDPHAVRDVDGRWIKVRKEGKSFFEEDARQPSYFPEDVASTENLPHIYVAPKRPWWGEIAIGDGRRDVATYERWQMLQTWNARIAPILDASLTSLPPGPVLWRVHFEGDQDQFRDVLEQLTLEDASAAIAVTTIAERNIVDLHIGKEFDRAFLHPENIAERALVERVVEGFITLAGDGRDAASVAQLVEHIVRDPKARQTHTFRNCGFRDRVRLGARRDKTVFVHEKDEAALRLGLGWRARDRALGGELTGKQDCTGFLNTLVRRLEDELCAELRGLDRAALIESALKNHEAAASERDQWERTVSAVMALHSDKEATYAAIAGREAQLAAVFQTCRTLCEFVLCESPLSGGAIAGKLDLARLMAKMALLINLGGWSDAIWLDAAEPRLRITALGDVHLNQDFIEDVVAPFGRAATDVRTNEAIRNYARNLEEVPFVPSVEHNFDPAFLAAVAEELGAGIDETRLFIEHIENLAVIAGQNVLRIPRSLLLTPVVEGRSIPRERAEALVAALSIPRRTSWREIPDGFEPRDVQPWRYRRRLSLLRRPLVLIDDELDPTILVAPGLLRDGFGYILANYYQGDFPQRQLAPKMRSWRGRASAKRGVAFNAAVAKYLHELGWQAHEDVKVSTILGASFSRYGDVDVLAWNTATGRILLIECKDLHFGKTLGEIAEQLAEFRGDNRADGKPDRLRRHLDRIDVLRAHADRLTTFVGLPAGPKIEGHLVFKNPVPMQFAGARIGARVRVHVFDGLTNL